MATHELKTWVEPFQAIIGGFKRAEFRKEDRGYRDGDTLVLREWDNVQECYTGRRVNCLVTDIREGGPFGIPEGYVMMSIDKGRWEWDS